MEVKELSPFEGGKKESSYTNKGERGGNLELNTEFLKKRDKRGGGIFGIQPT